MIIKFYNLCTNKDIKFNNDVIMSWKIYINDILLNTYQLEPELFSPLVWFYINHANIIVTILHLGFSPV